MDPDQRFRLMNFFTDNPSLNRTEVENGIRSLLHIDYLNQRITMLAAALPPFFGGMRSVDYPSSYYYHLYYYAYFFK